MVWSLFVHHYKRNSGVQIYSAQYLVVKKKKKERIFSIIDLQLERSEPFPVHHHYYMYTFCVTPRNSGFQIYSVQYLAVKKQMFFIIDLT